MNSVAQEAQLCAEFGLDQVKLKRVHSVAQEAQLCAEFGLDQVKLKMCEECGSGQV